MTGSHDEKFKLQQYILMMASSSIQLTSNIKEGWRWVLLAVLKFEHLSSGCFQKHLFETDIDANLTTEVCST